MRRVVVSESVSLDGTQEQNDFRDREFDAADALLVGRVTYEGFAAAWPDAPDTSRQ